MAKLDGSCLCGKVTYGCGDAEPVAMAICHCTECQKQTGTTFSIVAVVPRDALKIEGDSLSSFTTVGTDSGSKVARQFCRECGSPIASLSEGTPQLAFIKAGTLNEKSWFEPQMHVWCDSAQPWLSIDELPGTKLARGVPAQA
jgi:hypothetical protein